MARLNFLNQYYYYFYKNGAVENIFNLMENVTLDYDYMNTNSRFCFNELNTNEQADSVDNDEFKFKLLFLSISEVNNIKYRQAARQTYGKYLKKFNLKLLFVIGKANPSPNSNDQIINSKLKQPIQIREKRIKKKR